MAGYPDEKRSPNPLLIFLEVVAGFYLFEFLGSIVLRLTNVRDVATLQGGLHLAIALYVVVSFLFLRENAHWLVRGTAGILTGLLAANGWVTVGFVGWAGEHDFAPYYRDIIVFGLISGAFALAIVNPAYKAQRDRKEREAATNLGKN